jgi:adenylate kinase family enzyme
MLVKLFVLGRPGSGKTTAFYRIKARAEENGWHVSRVRDYKILQSMFQHDIEQKKFRPADHNGFDVIDFSVLNDALLEVERLVKFRMLTTKRNELIIVEFARDEYKAALEVFSPDFLQGTHILFVDADIDTCIQRIHQRISRVLEPDNHFISDTIMRSYYSKDNREYMKHRAILSANATAKEKRAARIVQYIENIGSLDYLYTNVDQFFNNVMASCIFPVSSHKIPSLTEVTHGVRGAK